MVGGGLEWRSWCRHINGFRVGVFPVGGRQLV